MESVFQMYLVFCGIETKAEQLRACQFVSVF